jgi:hypothetical protein
MTLQCSIDCSDRSKHILQSNKVIATLVPHRHSNKKSVFPHPQELWAFMGVIFLFFTHEVSSIKQLTQSRSDRFR